ncbi:hypothetical protein IU470_18700 [Nocardia abscessus]|uniref:Uncharacterized protein n=1 Tax=Nocardia abscessus TaxID=120957 RepID=A0ABS0C9S8_9NOCA|nr:hypothetical protein [Nocardia abscessus]MBF6227127.1 hypothetical protein [Nocardia abscessus]
MGSVYESDLDDERVIDEYRGTREWENEDGDLAERGQISEVDLRILGYRKEDLEAVFGPRTERTEAGRPVWNLRHVQQIEAERFGPVAGRIKKRLMAFDDLDAACDDLDELFTMMALSGQRNCGPASGAPIHVSE